MKTMSNKTEKSPKPNFVGSPKTDPQSSEKKVPHLSGLLKQKKNPLFNTSSEKLFRTLLPVSSKVRLLGAPKATFLLCATSRSFCYML